MKRLVARTLTAAACGVGLFAADIAPGRSERATPAQLRVPAQSPAPVKYIASGAIDVAAAVSDVRGFADGLAVDAGGNLYVAVGTATRAVEIIVLSPEGRLLRRWDPRGGASVGNPTQIAIGPDGLVYLRNRNERIIRVFTPEGAPVRTFGGSLSPNNVGDLELDAAGNVYTIDLGEVVKFNASGAVVATFTPFPNIADRELLRGLAVAPDGSLYVTIEPTQGGGLAEELPFLVHLDSSGRRLADPAPLLHNLLGFRARHGYAAKDVDFANGRLYIAGEGFQDNAALAVLAPTGQLISVIHGGRGEQVVVRGEDVYTTRVKGATQLRAPAQRTELREEIWHGVGARVNVPKEVWHTASACFAAVGEFDRLDRVVFWLKDAPRPGDCIFTLFQRKKDVCDSGTPMPDRVEVGGQRLPDEVRRAKTIQVTKDAILINLWRSQTPQGSIMLIGECVNERGGSTPFYEWKGDIGGLIDPSGEVVDAQTGRQVAGATVQLLFAPRMGAPFGRPGLSGLSPQLNPQVTMRSGLFGWDVLPGLWRLRITAFGYKPLLSRVFPVPPEWKGLRLRLQPSPRQQAVVIDPYAARAGFVRTGKARPRRAPGLRVTLHRGRVRTIVVRSSRYRTTDGIRIGSVSGDLLQAYPSRANTMTTRLLNARRPVQHRVGKATFTVRNGRVVGIRLGR